MMVSRFSWPDNSFIGTETSYPPWNFRSNPTCAVFVGLTFHGKSLRGSGTSRIAWSVPNKRTMPPDPVMISWPLTVPDTPVNSPQRRETLAPILTSNWVFPTLLCPRKRNRYRRAGRGPQVRVIMYQIQTRWNGVSAYFLHRTWLVVPVKSEGMC